MPDFAEMWHAGALWIPKGYEIVKINFRQIQDGGQPLNFKSQNRYNSAADCLVSLKFGTAFDHMNPV